MSDNIVATSLVAAMEMVTLAIMKNTLGKATQEEYNTQIKQAEYIVEKALEIYKP